MGDWGGISREVIGFRFDRIEWINEGNLYSNERNKHSQTTAEGINIKCEGIISGLIESSGNLIEIFSK
ncbi:hypothetical protein JMA_07440 [Jeotgalibacillus malaysiensis]|uniref:Uncharacterized protein n=1 Tax=Jeotgalibacillus malaysiensis TaxID=1508404 RepID=A0A0B5AJ03_9BACL|nr:hypothetical protein JMA_07440 [Jeotgalibacillus malaysiensis]